MRAMSGEKTSLNSFRAFLFFFFGGAGCLLPFISLHLRSTGLSTDEIRLISYVSPLFATLGPIFVGPLLDYLSERRKKSSSRNNRSAYVKTILSITILLSAVFYCLLLSVSTIENVNLRQPEASFVCNEQGASLVQTKCNDLSCFKYANTESGTATLENCKFHCNLPPNFGYLENPHQDQEGVENLGGATLTTTTTTTPRTVPRMQSLRPEVDISNLDDFFGSEPNDDYDDSDVGSGEDSEFNWSKRIRRRRDAQTDSGFLLEESPHICHDKLIRGKTSRTCFVFTPNSAAFNVSVQVKPFHEDGHHCSYSLGSSFSCRIPRGLEKPNESCKVICDLEKVYSSGNVLFNSQCSQILNDPSLTFWTYLTFRALGDLFFAASVSIIIGAAIVAAGDDAGREFILPTLTYGLLAVVVGYLHSDDMSPLQLENIPNFSLGIIGFGIFITVALLVLVFSSNLCIGPPDWWKTNRNARVRQKAEFYAVLVVLVLLGMLWGPIYFQVPWHIPTTEGLELYVGCAAAVGSLLSLPLVWKVYKIVDYCGYSNLLIGAFTIYILRYTGLLFIENPWVLSIIGCMEAFTLCLMLFSAVFYIRHLVPKRLTFTSQALGVAAHFCLGGGLGCLVSTLLSPSDSYLQANPRNVTTLEVDLETVLTKDEFRALYHLIYCTGAVAAAIFAVVYFFLYHCCLKKRCFAPLYRNDLNGTVEQDAGEKGMYTPLRVIRNGKQLKDEVET